MDARRVEAHRNLEVLFNLDLENQS